MPLRVGSIGDAVSRTVGPTDTAQDRLTPSISSQSWLLRRLSLDGFRVESLEIHTWLPVLDKDTVGPRPRPERDN
jgi:hypothetical protein